MSMQLKSLVPAVLVLGGLSLLTGCGESGTPAGETTASPASHTTAPASTTDKIALAADAAEEPHTLASSETKEKTLPALTKAGNATTVEKKPSADGALDPNMLSVNKATDLSITSGEQPQPRINLEGDPNGTLTVHAEPAILDIGDIATGESGVGTIKLINDGTEPVKLVECRSSCGCTAAKCPRGQTIEPGSAVDVEVSMTGLTKPSETQTEKVIRFIIEGQPQLAVQVKSRTISFVNADPWSIDKDTTEENSITLTSTDDQAFRIVKMHPPIVEEFSAEPLSTHTVEIDWTKWEELGSSRRLTFYMDHPRCDKLFVSVEFAYKQRPPMTAVAQPIAPGETADGTTVGMIEAREGANPIPFAPPVSDPASLIKAGKKDELIQNLEDGTFELEETDRTGATLLSQAAHHGQIEIVSELLARGADIESQDRIGKTPLMWAGHAKNVDLIKTLLEAGADINARDSVVGTALSWTAGFGDGGSVRALLEAGADPNVTGTMGFTPIIWAALTGDADSVAALVEAGAEIEKADLTPSGATPLMHASQTGKADNVRVLVQSGAKLESKDNEGKTPLLIASEKSGGNVETLKVLVEAGADLTAKDLRGRTALDLARTRTDPRAPEVVAYLETVMGVAHEAPQPATETPGDE